MFFDETSVTVAEKWSYKDIDIFLESQKPVWCNLDNYEKEVQNIKSHNFKITYITGFFASYCKIKCDKCDYGIFIDNIHFFKLLMQMPGCDEEVMEKVLK